MDASWVAIIAAWTDELDGAQHDKLNANIKMQIIRRYFGIGSPFLSGADSRLDEPCP
jgi:hypothetical protein